MRTKHSLIAAAALTAMATSVCAVDWGGYVRVGPGQKENSGDGQRCFNGGGSAASGSAAPGHGGIGRLGNECHTYGEFALSQGLKAGGVDYKATLMTNFSSAGGSGANGLGVATQQIYVEGKGYDIAPDQTFWIGERFYHRADVHWDDSFYVNMSGTGAGVDGISVAGGSLGLAIFRTGDAAAGGNSGTRLNGDLEGINVNPGGKLRVTLDFTSFSGPGGKNGTGLSLQHNQANIFGAENVAWLQFAQGSASTNMAFGNATDGSGTKSWRIADSLTWTTGPLTAQTLVHYGRSQTPSLTGGTTKVNTLSVGGRVGYAISRNFKLQGELATARTKPDATSSQSVTKLTIAPTLTVGPNYYDRPELRFYVSTFSMNDAYAAANGQTKKSKTAAGFQAEIWF
jgi:maltoporin